jgi:pimeloyl-ACP methyl ester carboxylesterase
VRLGLRSTFIAALIVLVASASCGRKSDRESSAREAVTPLVFVHGSGLSPASWERMRLELERAGYPREAMEEVDIPPRRSANEMAAASDITSAVERVRGRAAKVDLIGHSMGAFSSRYFAAVLHPERVRVWIGIAGSNYGTNALCGSSLAGDRQMCPAFAESSGASEIQVRLNGSKAEPRDPSPYGIGADGSGPALAATSQHCIAYYTIRIEPDEWIQPERSATLAGAGGLAVAIDGLPAIETEPGNFLFTAPIDHDHLPSHPQLIELVARILRAADRELPQRCPG